MENTEMFWGIMGAIGALAGLMIGCFLYQQRRLDKMASDLNNAIGRLSIIQDMFKEFMGWFKPSLDMSPRGRRGEASAGEAGEVREGGNAGEDAPRRSAPVSPPSGPHP